MPNRQRSLSKIDQGRHVVVISRIRFDGDFEVVSVLVSEVGCWRKPLGQGFTSHESALNAGAVFADEQICQFDAVGERKRA